MVLSLISPVGPNFLKDFPTQNASNCNEIDDYAGPCLLGQALRLVNPGVSATVTAPTLGTGGFSNAYYYQIFDQIYMWGEWRFGTAGINVGSGIYTLTLPFNVASNLGANANIGLAPIVGQGSTYDQNSNPGRLPLDVHLKSANEIYFGIRNNAGTGFRELRESLYTVWAVNDGVTWAARFKRIP